MDGIEGISEYSEIVCGIWDVRSGRGSIDLD